MIDNLDFWTHTKQHLKKSLYTLYYCSTARHTAFFVNVFWQLANGKVVMGCLKELRKVIDWLNISEFLSQADKSKAKQTHQGKSRQNEARHQFLSWSWLRYCSFVLKRIPLGHTPNTRIGLNLLIQNTDEGEYIHLSKNPSSHYWFLHIPFFGNVLLCPCTN